MFSISINGSLVGYFKRARGVRQGDPLSLYLFVLAINVLCKMIDTAANYGVINYHPKCKRVKLTHLCFADDLLIFVKRNMKSVNGLQINCSKSEIFSAGMTRDMLEMIHQKTGFKIRPLPVRYLGAPLVTKRLSIKDC